jgi:hypothetical protein
MYPASQNKFHKHMTDAVSLSIAKPVVMRVIVRASTNFTDTRRPTAGRTPADPAQE